jgi:hypothetical protein
LAYVAGRDVRVDPEELAAARRRALLIVTAGGDPHRELALGDRAVVSLADDLDDPARRRELVDALARLHELARGLPYVSAVVAGLAGDAALAWRAYACALLAEELLD